MRKTQINVPRPEIADLTAIKDKVLEMSPRQICNSILDTGGQVKKTAGNFILRAALTVVKKCSDPITTEGEDQ